MTEENSPNSVEKQEQYQPEELSMVLALYYLKDPKSKIQQSIFKKMV